MKDMGKVMGALYGVAIGDALGAPITGKTAKDIREAHGTLRDMVAGKSRRTCAGMVTNVTHTTIDVAKSILQNPSDPIPEMGRKLIDRYIKAPATFDKQEKAALSHARRTKASDLRGWHNAAQRAADGIDWEIVSSAALARLIYPALIYDTQAAQRVAAAIGRMTNAHDHSARAILTYTAAVSECINADKNAGPVIMREFVERRMLRVRRTGPSDQAQPNGDVLSNAVCAMDAIRDTDNFEDAVIYAVNLGGDAATVGAITGGLAGAIYGVEEIPRRWARMLPLGMFSELERLAKKAYSAGRG